MTVTLTGTITAPPEAQEAVAAALPLHITLTRQEPGCLQFEVTPDPEVAGRYQVFERFAKEADFNHHQARAGASDWAKASATCARDYVVTGLS